jgi:tungstate transport system substrate-binding protein
VNSVPGVRARVLLLTLSFLVLVAAPAARAATEVVVQGTTDTRDAGLVDDVIVPGFQAAYPQYTLKYIAVGTGQALTNARAGQADAVLTHSPPLEAQFVADGYSYEPAGRAVMYNDYVLAGHNADPAGVAAGARNDAVHAFELIAQSGATGSGIFVSRGDNSGTNTEEQSIWCLTTGIALHTVATGRCEPDGDGNPATVDYPAWYQRAGLGQAATLKLAEECTFAAFNGGSASADRCYDLTDRGTFNRQTVVLGTVAGMKVVSDRNAAGARGGGNLLLNQFNVYAVNPAKVPSVKLPGALAFLDYVTSPAFQARLDGYPTTANPAFFQDAFPLVRPASTLPTRVRSGDPVSVGGRLSNRFPGAGPVGGSPLSLDASRGIPGSAFGPFAPVYASIGAATSAGDGNFFASGPLVRSGALRVSVPRFGVLSPTTLDLGVVRVGAVVNLNAIGASYRTIRVRGDARPTSQRDKPVLVVLGTRLDEKGQSEKELGRKALPATGGSFDVSVPGPTGKWSIRAQYQDPTAVEPGTSTARTLSIPGKTALKPSRPKLLSGGRVQFKGKLSPAALSSKRSRLVLLGLKTGTAPKASASKKYKALKTIKLRKGDKRFKLTAKLKAAKYKLRLEYRQPGLADNSLSGVYKVSVRR